MHTITITDPTDARLDGFRDLTDQQARHSKEEASGTYIAESFKVLERAIDAGHEVLSVLAQDKWVDSLSSLLAAETPVVIVSAEVAESVTGFAVHRGVMAVMRRPPLPTVGQLLTRAADAAVVQGVRTRSRIVVLENLTDHTNVGAIFRSAAALGIDAILMTTRGADPLYRRSVRVSMGTVFQVPWTRIHNWPGGMDELKAAGYVVAGMTLGEGSESLDELVAEDHDKLALVFGTEGDGLTPHTNKRLDRRVTIPMMAGIDSLNVAASSAVAFYATK